MAWAVSLQRAESPGTVAVPQGVAEEAFLAWARGTGLEVCPLRLEPVRRAAEGGTEPLRVSWTRRHQVRLLGRRLLAFTWSESGLFDRYEPQQLVMPVAAERLAVRLLDRPEVEEVSVLVEQRVDPILAVRVGERWYEVLRWFRRPYVITPEEVSEPPSVRAWWPLRSVGALPRRGGVARRRGVAQPG